MTKDENATKDETSSGGGGRGAKEKTGRQRGQRREKVKAPTKIIVRHLPPTMTEEDFLKQTDPLPEHDCYYFAAADWSLGYDATCRAYLTLKRYEDVFLFRDRFDGYVFVDAKGAEYPAIVEFAPFQGLLKNKSRRSDNKVASIEMEPHYQQFLAKLDEDREAAAKGGECKLEFTLDRKKDEKITSTPLLQYLANKKEKRREEARKRTEEKRRQRDDDKDKRRAGGQGQQQQVSKIMGAGGGAGGRGEGGGGRGEGAGKEGGQLRVGGGGGGGEGRTAGGKENAVAGKSGEAPPEERKNSRSKRRAERDNRRREAHEQRKRELRERGGVDGVVGVDIGVGIGGEKEKSETSVGVEMKRETASIAVEATKSREELSIKEEREPKSDKPNRQQNRQDKKKQLPSEREQERNRNRRENRYVAEGGERRKQESNENRNGFVPVLKSWRSTVDDEVKANKMDLRREREDKPERVERGEKTRRGAERAKRAGKAERAERYEREQADRVERALTDVNESVRIFIRSAATAKEFVPRHKQPSAEVEADPNAGARNNDNEQMRNDAYDAELKTGKSRKINVWAENVTVSDAYGELKELAVLLGKRASAPTTYISQSSSDGGRAEDDQERDHERKSDRKRAEPEEESKDDKDETSSGGAVEKTERTARRLQKQRSEERRIRNKDRPSIAIYQPKLRTTRASDEGDLTTGGRDVRSNPNSDSESIKREEHQPPRVKKVSRYSERRLQLANREKPKSVEEVSNDDDVPLEELPKSHASLQQIDNEEAAAATPSSAIIE